MYSSPKVTEPPGDILKSTTISSSTNLTTLTQTLPNTPNPQLLSLPSTNPIAALNSKKTHASFACPAHISPSRSLRAYIKRSSLPRSPALSLPSNLTNLPTFLARANLALASSPRLFILFLTKETTNRSRLRALFFAFEEDHSSVSTPPSTDTSNNKNKVN